MMSRRDSWSSSTRPMFFKTPPRDSPTASVTAWARKSESAPENCTRAVPWASKASQFTSTSCSARVKPWRATARANAPSNIAQSKAKVPTYIFRERSTEEQVVEMKLRSTQLLFASCFLLVVCNPVQAQNHSEGNEESCHRFSQGFYDWYVPQVFKVGGREAPWHVALKYKG